ncbi:helix-turn-helix domain-containing protein [Streptomyces niveus]|uniref:helix-turn-helix domain-containing protein n=1 Tax=Streptomyces niveus TaxID=193462 RepID=UPI00343443AE
MQCSVWPIECDQEVGPCSLVPSCFLRHLPFTSRRFDRGVGRPVACPVRVGSARAAWHRAAAGAGAGPKYDLVFTDRVLVTLVHLRTELPHAALAELYGTARSTVSRAIGEIRPLLAARGFADVPVSKNLAEVVTGEQPPLGASTVHGAVLA